MTDYNFNADYPEGFGEFLGLYPISKGLFEHKVIRRAQHPNGPFRFITEHGGPPHFIQDPVAWAPLPVTPGLSDPIERSLVQLGQNKPTPDMMHRMQLQKDEFDTLDRLVTAYKNLPAVVDDDYPEMRHYYDSALRIFLKACVANGRGKQFGIE